MLTTAVSTTTPKNRTAMPQDRTAMPQNRVNHRWLLHGLLVGFLLASLTLPAAAQPLAGECVIGPGFGSTLLYPYFEVDLDDPLGVTTLISVNNGFNDETLVRVVLWTDWGNPTVAFDVWLTGFDIQTINLRSVFAGNIPSTGGGVDLSAFEFCGGADFPPFHDNPVLTAEERNQLAADHQGKLGPLSFGECAGQDYDDGIARGYVTVDVVDECHGVEGFFPNFTPANLIQPYFADGGDPSGIAVIDNRLWGDLIYVDFTNNSAQGSEAIALWADATLFAGTDIFTFYGGFSGFDGRDDRVPLPSLWNQRFLNGGAFAGGADLIVFNDNAAGRDFPNCGTQPSWFPLVATGGAVDEDNDNFVDLGDGLAPVVTQRVPVGSLGIPYDFGLLQVITPLNQSWVQPTLAAGGLFSAAFNGAPAVFLCDETPGAPM